MTVKIDIHTTDKETGETRVLGDDYGWGGDENIKFMFGEGNYACDCNRDLFFHRARGVEPEHERECGEERYSVQIFEQVTGRLIYEDGPKPV